jgi:hypothetical protein
MVFSISSSEDVSDRVNSHRKTGISHQAQNEFSTIEICVAEGNSGYSAVWSAANLGELMQVVVQAIGVDQCLGHGSVSCLA